RAHRHRQDMHAPACETHMCGAHTHTLYCNTLWRGLHSCSLGEVLGTQNSTVRSNTPPSPGRQRSLKVCVSVCVCVSVACVCVSVVSVCVCVCRVCVCLCACVCGSVVCVCVCLWC